MLFFGLDFRDSCGRDARYTKGCCKEKKDLHDDGLIRRERRDAGRSLELVVVGKDISREGKKEKDNCKSDVQREDMYTESERSERFGHV